MGTFRYTVDGNTVPSVTTVIGILGENKRALIHSAWKLGMEGKNYRDEWGSAAKAGTAAHSLAESHMTGKALPDLSSLVESERRGALDRFESFKEWLSVNRYEPVASEVSMVSRLHLYGGTIDAVGVINGKPALIDLKSKTLFKDQIIQVAAYRLLWNENHPDMEIESVHVVGMSDGFHHHLVPFDIVDAGEAAFMHLRSLYDALKGIRT